MSALQKNHNKSVFIFRCSLWLHLLLELIINVYYVILVFVILAALNDSYLVLGRCSANKVLCMYSWHCHI